MFAEASSDWCRSQSIQHVMGLTCGLCQVTVTRKHTALCDALCGQSSLKKLYVMRKGDARLPGHSGCRSSKFSAAASPSYLTHPNWVATTFLTRGKPWAPTPIQARAHHLAPHCVQFYPSLSAAFASPRLFTSSSRTDVALHSAHPTHMQTYDYSISCTAPHTLRNVAQAHAYVQLA